MENLKVFEMPVPGYLGFPAFALECFTMYVFVRTIMFGSHAPTLAGRVRRGGSPAPDLGRPIAL